MTGSWTTFDWRGRPAQAWIPEPLGQRNFDFAESTIRSSEQASGALGVNDRLLPANWEPLARLMLRTEGIASSSIEGVRAPLVEVALAELADASESAGWIASNLSAVADALASPDELSVDTMHAWHRRLMSFSGLAPEMIGAFRTAPSWICGTSPLDAAFVPPPAERVPELMGDLIDYANQDHFDPVTHAALIHAQFETIHPYGDGNGRLGRILIGWLLKRRGVITKLPPPISVLIARDPGGYISGLHLFREGPVDAWVRWFTGIANAAATQSAIMIEGVTAQLDEWRALVSDLRSDASARLLIDFLPQVPVVSSGVAGELLGTSDRSARTALELLAERGILERIDVPHAGPGRPARHYAAKDLLDAMAGWGS